MHLFALVIILALSACSHQDSGEPDDGESETAVFDGLELEIADARCDAILRCCDSAALDVIFPGFEVSSKQDCERPVTEFVRVAVLGGLKASLRDSAIEVSDGHREACVEAMRQQSCADISAGLDLFEHAECREFMAPALETSQFCTEDYTCRSGFCALSDATLEGSCAEAPEVGDACRASRCGKGAYCDGQAQICTALRSSGETCTRNEECLSDACVSSSESGRICADEQALCQEGP